MAPAPEAVPGERRADGLAGRVVLPVALGHRPAHHRRDPGPHPHHPLSLLVPDRQQDRHHVRGVDPAHRPQSKPRHRLVSQARAPQLLGPAAVLPPGRMDRNDLLHGLGEGGDGPAAAGDQPAALAREEVQGALLAGLCEADVGPGAESEVAGCPSMLMGCPQDLAGWPRAVRLTRRDRPPEPRPSP